MTDKNIEPTPAEICALRLIKLCKGGDDYITINSLNGTVCADNVSLANHAQSLCKKGIVKIENGRIYIKKPSDGMRQRRV